ncbi:hypothetical protein LAUMK136_03488 [Mycobacterium attenuatum]|uniref:Tc1-like transposase DDE domain-containing protein n=1 Tax=Mycobacterium attenuatum TaxID=2341086 RepID=A0A498Q607_9MYCO|nr:IS630 family transposase [Mycobacterium attenuatum]VBA40389.1 hypothetical protein LAUMK136_03488 [Mycobacterium attenuatum]
MRRRKSAAGLALRARIVLAAADGGSNVELAERLELDRGTIRKWRNRFVQYRCDDVLDEPRPGRPRLVGDGQIEALITATLESAPPDATHWSTRSMAEHLGLSQSMVSRVWRAFGSAPHKQDSWKLSKDPLFVEKVRDVVGLCLAPPERAVVLCVDEKTTHTSVRQLNADIRAWIQTSNDSPRPYVWTKTADQILESVANKSRRINDSGH